MFQHARPDLFRLISACPMFHIQLSCLPSIFASFTTTTTTTTPFIPSTSKACYTYCNFSPFCCSSVHLTDLFTASSNGTSGLYPNRFLALEIS